VLAGACSPGTLTAGRDSGVDGDGDADADGSHDSAPADPCEAVRCPMGQSCMDGRCRMADLCEGVVCDNPGEVCDPRDGACQPGGADEDADGHTIAAGDCDDGNGSIFPGAEELCDGVDQDCDLDVDEGFPDVDDDGYDTCGFGDAANVDCDDHEPLRNPGERESCDGLDNDCDGSIDDGVAPRPCSTHCGSGEERCEGGRWSCSAPETCECTPAGTGELEACGNCGERSRSCDSSLRWDPWSACAGEGPCVPSTTDSCVTSCASAGTHLCAATCEWEACVPPAEICNGVDDDCDDEVDEGFRAEVVATTFDTLASFHSLCDGVEPRISLACNSAIHLFCASRPCSASGFGPVEWSGDDVWVVCVADVDVRVTSYTTLATFNPNCDGVGDGRFGRSCGNAAKRYCVGEEFVSGFGPFVTSGDTARVTCVHAAANADATYTGLSSFNPLCDGVTTLWGTSCHSAVHRFCAAGGHVSGFGPMEQDWTRDIAWVTCVDL